MIPRLLQSIIENKLALKKVLIIYGARQVGKSSLLQAAFGNKNDVVWLNGEDIEVQMMFEDFSEIKVRALMDNKSVLIIDEAQNILNIGQKLKIIYDRNTEFNIIATGSSSFDLANKINEPLTGRKLEYFLYPLSFSEMVQYHGFIEEKKYLNHRLVYGYYPEIVNSKGNEKELLKNLSSSYLYKDILRWENLKKSDRIQKLLQAIAFQVGFQVSYSELGQMCGLDNKTIEKYISLLEQAFVIFRLPSFSRNLRNELKFSKKIYFYDNGIRNSIISNFNPLELRNDSGALFENFIISERIKVLQYKSISANQWFWRTNEQQEIDYIEEIDGILSAFEFKWNSNKKTKFPKQFMEAYPATNNKIITPQNIEEFLMFQ